MKFLPAILLSGLILMVSCTSYQVKRQLNDIESYIQDHPDSALTTLEDIDRTSLISKRNKAHHALLHAMALDKNYINVTDDSLSRVALDYFNNRGSKKYKARALYYLGLSKYYDQRYSDAIIFFTQSEDVSRESLDSLYLAFSLVGQADVYNQIYNDSEEIDCLNEAVKIFKKLSKDYYEYATKSRLGDAYIGCSDFVSSERILSELLDSNKYDNLYALTLNRYAYLQMVKEPQNPELASKYYSLANEEYSGNLMTIRDYWAWATALSMTGKREAADDLIYELLNVDTSYVSNYWLYLIAKDNGDIHKSLHYLEKSWNEGDAEVESALRQSLARYQRDYYHLSSILESNKAEKSMYLILLSAFVMLFAFILGYFYIKKIRRDKISLLSFADEMSKIAKEEQTRNNALKKKYISLYQSKFDTIRSLCYQYFVSENRLDAEKLMYSKVSSLIAELRCDKKSQKKMEKMLDQDLDGIMTLLRSEMPKFKELDYILFSYLMIGFDTAIISQLTGVSEGNIYAHKRRIRLKIQNSHPPHEEQFIEMLS